MQLIVAGSVLHTVLGMYMQARAHTHIHTHTLSLSRSLSLFHTHTHTHTHTRTHTHTHAHTHTAFGQISLLTDMAIEGKKEGLTIADAEDGA